MGTLVLIRHGQSIWNAQNRFTGWVDVDLSERGIEEAKDAGKLLENVQFDAVFASGLIRAQRTADIILEINKSWDGEHVHHDSRLNERNYGDLQGRNKQECREEFGDEQVRLWRRSFKGQPPGGESLEMTAKRALPCLVEDIVPLLEVGETVLVAAHGNSLRSLVMEIEGLSPEAIVEREIPTGTPMAYSLASGVWSRLDLN
ncbi:2,3-diphosphoglycerate-dependent phosphoglycerate mutase [Euryarchaeota archaeon]|nr:2,3-diphosphoglycerate-dependent phosphoglycerate mutase [Euryarchaeota archaeon]MDA9696017.1 2,3-diphosphoglycerate-dependent phosphoglycerate mutase [Euryarchaeota archaeon]